MIAGPAMLTNHGKDMVTLAMFEKGKAFIGAAVLVDRKNGHRAVVLHLLCQGIEIILKAILLKVDYARFKPQLRKLGHNLKRTAREVRSETGLRVFPGAAGIELATLDNYYRQHLLRYASSFDILIDPNTIPSAKALWHTAAIIRLCESKRVFTHS